MPKCWGRVNIKLRQERAVSLFPLPKVTELDADSLWWQIHLVKGFACFLLICTMVSAPWPQLCHSILSASIIRVVHMNTCVPVHAHTPCAHRPAIFSIPPHLPDNLGVVRLLFPTRAGKWSSALQCLLLASLIFSKKPRFIKKQIIKLEPWVLLQTQPIHGMSR